MTKTYLPSSPVLHSLIDRDGDWDEDTIGTLVALTRDPDVSNRDWATMLLAQGGGNTPAVRAALLEASADAEPVVRAEAILGLAERDAVLALPLLREELRGDMATIQLFEAAEIVAHPSLAEDVRAFANPSGNESLDEAARRALAACEARGKGAAPVT